MLLSMSPKELNRVDVIRDISERKLRQKDAAELLKLISTTYPTSR